MTWSCLWTTGLLLLTVKLKAAVWASDRDAVFIREFTLIRRDHLSEEPAQKPEDPSSRTARSEEDRDTLWDAWGSWSECSRTCGGGASYSLRRCLSSNNVDCPPDAGDFRAQQCSAHADVRHQGQLHDWLPLYNDPDNPCALKCRAEDPGLVVELAPKVLDGTRCYTESLDMCISGVCQIVGCDHELGSAAKEDNCGVCDGDGSSCRLVRGHYKSQHATGKAEDTVVAIPYKSRHVRLVLKGPDHLYVESKTLQGIKTELTLDQSGQYHLENTTLDFQRLSDKEVLRVTGPLGADFTVKIQLARGADSVVQYIYYQPIVHRWRETDFFPCSVTCGGGYQLTSAECFDLRTGRVVVDQYCHYYPENVKPKPKLQECNMEPCLDSDGYKEIMPYDLYHPLPRWESSPWTACSASCGGGGIQSRSVTCVEEDMQGTITPTDEWKCLYSPKTAILQPCNAFDCPTWLAQEWSPCTVTCGQGLRYRVVLCLDHRGLHAGGCSPATKPHIKEECLVTVPCYRSIDTLPVEAKPVWHKQAIELEEEVTATEEPSFVPGPWQLCSRTCGVGTQRRAVRCQVLLSFSQAVADLPDDECDGDRPASVQPCFSRPCSGGLGRGGEEEESPPPQTGELHDWEYEGFTACSESCAGGVQEAVVICLNKQTRTAADQRLCGSSRRPPRLLQDCNTQPCPPRWESGEWSSCSVACGLGLMTRAVACAQRRTSRSGDSTTRLKDEDCPGPKPSPFQACNRFDCPPGWDARDWGECSRTCGGGVRRRRVLCKQRLADGGVLELPDSFCPPSVPVNQSSCGGRDCPPQWVTTDWSQCSVTCGNGVQTLGAVCKKQGGDGQFWTVDPGNCSVTDRPIRIRQCFLKPCQNSPKPEPTVLARRKVYIQWRKVKKVQLVVGGSAYLLPWTTVILRCPARRVRGGLPQWLKDGKPLAGPPHFSVKSRGYLKIQRARTSDSGVYTCVVGQAREHLALQIVGSKRTLSVPEPRLLDGRREKAKRPAYTELPASLNKYDALVERLLELKGSILADKPHSSERNGPVLEEEVTESSVPVVLAVDSHKLDELMDNLSEGFKGPQGDQLIKLLRELGMTRGDSQDGAEPPTQGSLLYEPNLKPRMPRPRKPAIVQRPGKVGALPRPEVVADVGAPVFLQKQVASVELRCEALGDPRPTLTWTKNDKALRFDGRVGLLASGSLRIQSPGKGDQGLYTCTAKNHLGSTSLSSWLRITSDKVGSCIHGNGTGPDCFERTNGSRSAEACQGPACPPSPVRWRVEPWSPCSASCGGGSQTRRVRCLRGPEGSSGDAGSSQCLGAGRKPSDARLCNILPCAGWTTTPWGPCHGRCVSPSLATQRRHVSCQDANGTKVPYKVCHGLRRPSSLRNCSTDACALRWHVGPWTQCTATCGRHGFQSRQVTCQRRRTDKAARERRCMWRPAGWQRCNVSSCGGAAECRDSTRYCEKVRQLDLCPLPQFQSRCCLSCRDT
ncbi:ADAMTS-like protein 1 isoform X3 [Kryptolebias marmoratus]|uniref:ADAMTS-like protein 1 isoform X3 n=1 Tax=Kryptolebias marmoratus TaxID=37003 RepID=UPI0018AC9021|nr:ADAMTS-like protein 1 isoform X3 [Kryptolebias marmoratus]